MRDSFLTEVLGADGARALLKASAREPALANVVMPRAIVGWLQFTAKHGYEGPVPGHPNSYVQFSKSERGFSGSIGIGEDVLNFEDSSIHHLAASLAVALNVDLHSSLSKSLRDTILVKLGSSIDTLIKSQVLLKELKAEKTSHLFVAGKSGTCSTCGEKEDSSLHTAMDKAEGPGGAAPPIKPEGPITAEPPKKQPKMQKPPSLSIGKSEASKPCSFCMGQQFRDNRFTGCMCFRSLSKGIITTAYSDGFVLDFKPGFDPEAVRAIVDAFRSDSE